MLGTLPPGAQALGGLQAGAPDCVVQAGGRPGAGGPA